MQFRHAIMGAVALVLIFSLLLLLTSSHVFSFGHAH